MPLYVWHQQTNMEPRGLRVTPATEGVWHSQTDCLRDYGRKVTGASPVETDAGRTESVPPSAGGVVNSGRPSSLSSPAVRRRRTPPVGTRRAVSAGPESRHSRCRERSICPVTSRLLVDRRPDTARSLAVPAGRSEPDPGRREHPCSGRLDLSSSNETNARVPPPYRVRSQQDRSKEGFGGVKRTTARRRR